MPSQATKRKLVDVREIGDDPNSSPKRWVNLDKCELRDDRNGDLHLIGYASTYDEYEMYGGPENYGWIEKIDRNAFNRTLSERPDVQLLLNHAGAPLARTISGTLKLSADDHGLKVDALLDRTDPDVQALIPKMNRGDLDQMSFAFRVKDQEWSAAPGYENKDDMSYRLIKEVSLQRGDVSVVNYGANPHTTSNLTTIGEAVGMLAHAELAEVRGVDGGDVRAALRNLAKVAKIKRADLDDDPTALIAALDATLDEAVNLIAAFNRDDVDPAVLQVFDLVVAAESVVDELMEVQGVLDPDDEEQEGAAPPSTVRKAARGKATRSTGVGTIAKGLRIEVGGKAEAPVVQLHDASGLLDEALCAVLAAEVREAVLGNRGTVSSAAPATSQGEAITLADANHLAGRSDRVEAIREVLGTTATISLDSARGALLRNHHDDA